jgi:hypothetical protein
MGWGAISRHGRLPPSANPAATAATATGEVVRQAEAVRSWQLGRRARRSIWGSRSVVFGLHCSLSFLNYEKHLD